MVEERTAPDGSDTGPRLAQLFQVLDTPEEQRSQNLDEQLAAFAYVNGKRVQAVKAFREASKSSPTRALAASPTRFHVENRSSGTSIVIPKVSSERRQFIPFGFEQPTTFCSDLLFLLPSG